MGFLSKMKKEMKELVEKMAENDERRVFAHYMVSPVNALKPPRPSRGAHRLSVHEKLHCQRRGGIHCCYTFP